MDQYRCNYTKSNNEVFVRMYGTRRCCCMRLGYHKQLDANLARSWIAGENH